MGWLAKADMIIQNVGKKVFSETLCPFQSLGSNAQYCSADCQLIIVRYSKVSGKTVFVGCSLKWSALCSDKVDI